MLRAGCAGVLALGLVGLAPAAAQTVVVPAARVRVVSPDAVLAHLRSNGFSPLERPIRRGVTYALRAVDADGEPVRVIVDARAGTILAVTPLGPQRLPPGPGIAAAPMAPGPNVRRSPNAPPDEDVVLEPPPGRAPAGPPVVYQSDPPMARPPAPVQARPPVVVGRPQAGDAPPGAQVVAPEPNPNGALPPPPERFPQRVAPAPELKRKPAPPRRAVSAVLPKSPPLPRPKPEATVGQPPAGATPSAAPAPTPAAPAAKPSPADQLPN